MQFSLKRKIRLLKAAGCLFILGFALLYSHVEVGMSGIESGRFATIQAVAEQGVFYIENCNFRTVDRAIINNHVYSDKLPFLPLCLGAVYAPLHKLWGLNFVDNYHLSIYLLNFLLGAGVDLLLFLWLFDLLRSVKKGTLALKFILSLGCVAGSWIISYSTMINNHTPAALGVLGLFIALMRYKRKAALPAALLAGVAAGITGLLEVPCGFFFGLAAVAGIFWNAPEGKRFSHTAAVAGAGALCLAGGLVINFCAYGSILPIYMASAGGKGTFSPAMHPDFLYYCYHALIGDRGIFLYTPFLLVGVWYCVRSFKTFSSVQKICVCACGCFMAFYLFCTNEFGGQSYGLRYFIPVIPLLWFWGGKFFLELPAHKWKAPLLALLLIWGVVTGVTGAYFPYSVGNEGVRSPEGHFSRNFSSFGGNLLCWSYENFPQSALTRELINRYGVPESVLYMYWSFYHRKEMELLRRMQLDFPDLFPGKKAQ